MKKTISVLVMALALVSMMSALAVAKSDPEPLIGDMHKCCLEAAHKGEGCCGHSAAEIKAMFADHQAAEAVKADMDACCVKALAEGKGCCDHSAEELRADFTKKVKAHEAAAMNVDKEGCAAAAGCVKSCSASKASSCATKMKADTKAVGKAKDKAKDKTKG